VRGVQPAVPACLAGVARRRATRGARRRHRVRDRQVFDGSRRRRGRHAHEVLTNFNSAGKCVRSTFMYLGWLCGAKPDDSRNEAALRGAASFELLHTFALLQDDVMDDSAFRRGGPSAHVRFTRWHAERRLGGSAERFGASAAVLLGDLCLVWAEQMLRGSGLDVAVLERGWPRYDEMRSELAVGQFADLVNDAGQLPTLPTVLDVARRKSGNYTVRRPLEIGAALAGCLEPLLGLLGRYGAAVVRLFSCATTCWASSARRP
jgi:geranylgeranyl diphosphate synthase type I